MIAEILKEEFFSLEEMARVLRLKPQTLKRRIGSGTEHPPYTKIEGEYLFPRDLFRDWALKRPIIWEVRNVG